MSTWVAAVLVLPLALMACATSADDGDGEVLAVTGGFVVDPGGDAAPTPATLLIRDGRIAAMGAHVRVPRRARVIDAAGGFITPGLWDMHAHLNALGPIAGKPEQYVGHGVLGVREMGGHLDGLLALRREVAEGRIGPELVLAGPTLNGQVFGDFHRAVTTDAEARAAVRELHASGVDLIKVHRATSPAVLAAIIDEARQHDLPVAGHVPLGLSWVQGADMGMQSIEHLVTIMENELALPEDPAPDQPSAVARLEGASGAAAIAALARNNTYLDATLFPYDRRIARAPPEAAAAARPLLARAYAFLARARDAGVPIIAGSDETENPGPALWDELDLLVAAGLTPREALRAATTTAAAAARRPELGQLAVGAPARFLVLEADPTQAIANVRRLRMVVMGDRVLTAEELTALRSR